MINLSYIKFMESYVDEEKYAPIVIGTMSRYSHFKECLESLRYNTYANNTDVYIGLDYPPNEKYVHGYNKIKEYLQQNFSEFKSMNVIIRDRNYGSMKNYQTLIDEVLLKHDRFIMADDDLIFSRNYLEYMNKCLSKYEKDDDVIAVTGYSFPILWKVKDGTTVFKSNFLFSVWGVGFWEKTYRDQTREIYSGNIKKRFQEASFGMIIKYLKNMTMIRKYDIINAIYENKKDTLIDVPCDISRSIHIMLNKKYIITPIISKVRNCGFDGSGEYCPKINKNKTKNIVASNYDYSTQPIDDDKTFKVNDDETFDYSYNKKLYNSFDYIKKRSVLKMYLRMFLFLLRR